MDTSPQGPTRRAKLTVLLGAVNLARDVSATVPPARIAFAAVSTLLTMIRVRCLLFCDDVLLVHVYLGTYD